MKKAIIAATTAALLAGSVATYAANPGPGPAAGPAGGPPAAEQATDQGRGKLSPADRAALTDARIAALKTGLKLTADQEKLWPAVEAALRATAADASARRAEMQKMRADKAAPDPIERLRFQADMMTSRAGDLKKIADAAEPLYQTLDDGQKHRLQILLREDMPKGPFMHHGPGQGPGNGPGAPRRG